MTIWSHVARSRLTGLLALAAAVMAPLPVTAASAPNEYAEIDTREAVDLVKTLGATQGHENDALVATIQRQPQKYPPVVFFPMAQILYRQGDLDGAIFWLNAGRLRATFDARLCTDRSAGAGVGALMATMPPELRRAQFDDTGKLRAIIERVITWDETTPYDYDHRWIALHGLGAMRHGLGAGDNGPAQPLTIPKDQWDAVARKSRVELREGFALAIDSVEKNRPPQQAGAPQPGK